MLQNSYYSLKNKTFRQNKGYIYYGNVNRKFKDFKNDYVRKSTQSSLDNITAVRLAAKDTATST